MTDSIFRAKLAAAALSVLATVVYFPTAHAVGIAGPSGTNGPTPSANAPPAASATLERRGTELGFAVFQQHCVACHGNPAYERAPSPATLRTMSPERIYTALTSGVMKSVGDKLSEEDRRRVSESLAGQLLGSAQAGEAATMPNRCTTNLPVAAGGRVDWNGWGNGIDNNRFQPAAVAGLTPVSVPHLQLKWAFGYPGGTSAYGQPTVVGGRVFVGTDIGYVYSLDAHTGCVYWAYRAGAGVRNAMTVGRMTVNGKPHLAVFFGDQKATAYAIDAQNGTEIWKTRVEENFTTRVTAAPAVYGGRVYVPVASWEGFQARVPDYPCCTAVGSVSALDADTGKVIWKTYTIAERPHPTTRNSRGVQQWGPAGVPVWNTPAVDRQRRVVYVGTGDASTFPAPPTTDSILALSMQTGKVVWSQQIYKDDSFIVGCEGEGRTENCPKVIGPDWDIPMSPILKHLPGTDKTLIVFGTKPGEVLALDADKRGEQVWRMNPEHEASADSSPPSNGTGLRAAVWGAAVDNDNVYVGSSAGGVAAVQLTNGQRKWRSMLNATSDNKITHTAAVTVIPGVVFAAGTDGKLWALASSDGHVLWSFETARAFDTVNSVPAHGGSIVAAGPTVAGGMLFVGSGYGVVAESPGNVLLAFAVEE